MRPEIRRFEAPDERREFEKGTFHVLHLGGMALGRARYEPGWRWSEHVGAAQGESSCQVEHVGMVLVGRTVVAMDDGTEVELGAGDLFYVPPGHDSWVVGDEPYESLHLLGATEYAKASAGAGTRETPSAE